MRANKTFKITDSLFVKYVLPSIRVQVKSKSGMKKKLNLRKPLNPDFDATLNTTLN